MRERRPSRTFRDAPPSLDNRDRYDGPTVAPDLVDYLEGSFPKGAHQVPAGKGLDGAVDAAIAIAEERGREQVISRLRSIIDRQRGLKVA